MSVDNISVRLKNSNNRSTKKKKRRNRAIEYKTETFMWVHPDPEHLTFMQRQCY